MKRPPPRLFVLFARDAPVALILRRGPAAWYHVIRWHTDQDRFESGAWFRGRLYEDRCDLSPDGELFLYFAMQGSRFPTSYKGTWTAVSRAPWLHALVLWPQGDTWGGGGRFVGPRKVALRTCMPLKTHRDHPLVGLEAVPSSEVEGGAPRHSDRVSEKEWSGHDPSGARVFTASGKLFRERRGREVEIADFNDMAPDPQPPPDWATRPLPALRSKRASRRAR